MSFNPLRHDKKSLDVITGCRWNRPINLTNHRAAWHLSTSVGTFTQPCDWSTYAWSLKRAGLAVYFRWMFSNVFTVFFMNLKWLLIIWNSRIEWEMKKEYIKGKLRRILILKVIAQYLILPCDLAQLVV